MAPWNLTQKRLEPGHPAIEQDAFAIQRVADLLNALRIRRRREGRTGPHDAATGCGHGLLLMGMEKISQAVAIWRRMPQVIAGLEEVVASSKSPDRVKRGKELLGKLAAKR
jgi:hypothetical protein